MKKFYLLLISILLLGSACSDVSSLTPLPLPQPKYEVTQEQSFERNVPSSIPQAPNGYYINTAGNSTPRPYIAPSVPSGASAKCGDGTYSFSQSRRGTCSSHGGVSTWY